MIVERMYPGLELYPRGDYEEQLIQYRRDKKFLNERTLPVGTHPISQESGSNTEENMFVEMEFRVFPEGHGEIWGRLSSMHPSGVIALPMQVGNKIAYVIRRASPIEFIKVLELSSLFPWHGITTPNPQTNIRRLWREYEYQDGPSPIVQ